MLKQMKIKLQTLIYDDCGVAIAYTIMVFLFMFMLCVSVYAMSENIRKRMEMQNLCDAAAYSGAVVQADMLSRLAVLNRALSWTYAQTNMRQMDYIVDDWLQRIHKDYEDIKDKAHSANGGECVHGGVTPTNGGTCSVCGEYAWIAGCLINGNWTAGAIDLNGTAVDAVTIEGAKGNAFPDEETNISNGVSNIDVLNSEILWIQRNINIAISNAVNFTLQNADGTFAYYTDGAWGNRVAATYIVPQSSENAFLNYSGGTAATVFKSGYDNPWWWRLVSTPGANLTVGGFQRNYVQGTTALIANTDARSFTHNDDPDTGACSNLQVYTDTRTQRGSRVDSTNARPAMLTRNFFGAAGSIVVAMKRPVNNPFSAVFGDASVTDGLYAAFSGSGSDMWAVSAARAGIRLGGDPDGYYRVQFPGATYANARYTSGTWNLCEEDWDAVMIPVSRAWNDTGVGAWGTGSTPNGDTDSLLRSAAGFLSVSSNYGDNGYVTPRNPMRH